MDRRRGLLVSALALVALMAGAPERPARAAAAREPVIVIPGLAGSELVATSAFRLSVPNGRGGTYARDYRAGEKVWVNTWEAAQPGPDDYFDALKIQPDAVTPVAPQVAVAGVYDAVYGDLRRYLERQGYVPGVDLWVFPYDWRRDIRTTAPQLDALVRRALVAANGGRADPATWTVSRVDLVGHSMGGMVGRYYVSDPGRAARVDQLITLGSPQLGAVKFLKTLLYGDTFGPFFLGIGLDPEAIRDVVQNMPGPMQTLPSRAYYRLSDGGAPDRPAPYVEDRDVDGDGFAAGPLGYEGVGALLARMQANRVALGLAEAYHTALDEGRHGVHGVRWSALVGTGHATVGQLREYTGTCVSWSGPQPCPRRDELPVDGDGTVAVISAAMGDPRRGPPAMSGAELWYLPREHLALVSDDEVLGVRSGDGPALAWVGRMLSRPSGAVERAVGQLIYLPQVVAGAGPAASSPAPAHQPTVEPPPPLEGVWVSALGPVALEVVDGQGRAAGRERGEDAGRPGIPGASYHRSPEAEFAFVGRGAAYTLRVAAEGEGSLDLKVRLIGGGQVERTAVYLGVMLGRAGRAELTLAPDSAPAVAAAQAPGLAVDADGDGVFETVAAAALLDARESADVTPPEIAVAPAVLSAGGTAVSWSAADGEAGVLLEYAILDPGTPNARVVRSGEPLVLPPGEHRLVVLAQDRAGNTAAREVAVASP